MQPRQRRLRRDQPGGNLVGRACRPRPSRPWRSPDAPILIHPSQLRRIWRWGLDFLRASRPGPSWANTRHVLRLSLYSFEALKEIRAAPGVQYDAVTGGALKVYSNQRGLR